MHMPEHMHDKWLLCQEFCLPCLGTRSGFTWDAVHVRNLQPKLGQSRPTFFFLHFVKSGLGSSLRSEVFGIKHHLCSRAPL